MSSSSSRSANPNSAREARLSKSSSAATIRPDANADALLSATRRSATGRWRIGTAGWTLPKQHANLFAAAAEGEKLSHLERYSRHFNCVEVNSSFHRPHRRATWERWAVATPAEFLFAVKMPKTVTHTAKLLNTGALLQEFFDQVGGLGPKLGSLLVQLPPSLSFDEGIAHEFLTTLRELHPASAGAAPVTLEARHVSWFAAPADRLLRDFAVARVAADPPKGSPLAARPGGWNDVRYFRLHGSPRTYYSQYGSEFLTDFAKTLRADPGSESVTWVIFDNTALGHATSDAHELAELMAPHAAAEPSQ